MENGQEKLLMHLADAFVYSNLQWIQHTHFTCHVKTFYILFLVQEI